MPWHVCTVIAACCMNDAEHQAFWYRRLLAREAAMLEELVQDRKEAGASVCPYITLCTAQRNRT